MKGGADSLRRCARPHADSRARTDYVFDERNSTEQIYERMGQNMVQSALEGINSACPPLTGAAGATAP